jgi:hypothetical protein
MAVEGQMMGQQVRCPHCQQVVQTPALAPAAGTSSHADPEPVIVASPEEESIFTPPPQDDLFGDPKPPPTIEMPPEAGWPTSPASSPAPEHAESHDRPDATVGFTNGPAYSPSTADPLAFNTTTATPDASDRTAVLPPTDWSSPASRGTRQASDEEARGLQMQPARMRRPPERASATSWALIILIPYAIFMTAMALRLWFQTREPPSPLEYLPDEGENRGVTKKGEGRVSQYQQRWQVDSSLPSKLRVSLGNTLRVGALEVTPTEVKRSRVTYCYTQGSKPDTSAKDALVLRLHLKNVSNDQQFCPTDPAFDARWDDPRQPKPYTYLDFGAEKFFGGPIDYPYGKHGRMYMQGQENDPQPLGPGEERTTVVCTDPDKSDQVRKALAKAKGSMLWRVRLRRGLVDVGNKQKSATAVIGVEFAASDIR